MRERSIGADKALYRKIFVITLPIVIQNLPDSAVNITRNDVDGAENAAGE